MELISPLLAKSLMVTVFVSIMMVIIEYLNVMSRGRWFQSLAASQWRQYIIAVILGGLPGCMGAFVAVSLYSQRRFTLGALVATMIATSGDEMFVMLAMFPLTALAMTLALMLISIPIAWLVDRLSPTQLFEAKRNCTMDIHQQDACRCFDSQTIMSHIIHPSPHRAILLTAFGLLLVFILLGTVGPTAWNWKRITLITLIGLVLFILTTVPDHFLDAHLWDHIVRKHIPRIFAWTLGALLVITVINQTINLKHFVSNNEWLVLFSAGAVGILPESGPHLLFVSGYAENAVPLSILVASSAVQDGHGMLPLLSISKRVFITVKLINLLFGILIGAGMLALGY